MRVARQQGRPWIVDVPDAALPRVAHWFADAEAVQAYRTARKPLPSRSLPLDPRRLLALRCRYPEISVEEGLVRALEARLASLPREFGRHLHAHPEFGDLQARVLAEALRRRRHLLAPDAGFGKTPLAIDACRLLPPAILVVPPLIWRQSYAQDRAWWGSTRVVDCIDLSPEERRAALRHRADVYVLSPHALARSLNDLLDLPAATLVVDEFAATFRNPRGDNTAAVLALASRPEFVLPMTANPAPHHVGELWPAFAALDRKRAGSWREFVAANGGKATFADVEQATATVQAHADLMTVLPSESFWRHRPQLHRHVVRIDLSEPERGAYNALVAERRLAVGTDERGRVEEIAPNAGTDFREKLRELACGFVYDERHRPRWIGSRPAKAAWVVSLARRVAPEPIVIWCRYEAQQALLSSVLERAGVAVENVTGNNAASVAALQRWDAGQARVLLSNPKSAAHGVRLHRARHMVFAGIPDSMDEFYQAERREFRWPQRNDVHVWVLVARGTVDESALSSIVRRAQWREQFVAALRPERRRHSRHEEVA